MLTSLKKCYKSYHVLAPISKSTFNCNDNSAIDHVYVFVHKTHNNHQLNREKRSIRMRTPSLSLVSLNSTGSALRYRLQVRSGLE